MLEHDKDPSAEHEKRNKDWNGIMIRHSTAWFLLLIVMVSVWKMTQPVMEVKESGRAVLGESTATETAAAAGTVPSDVAGVTTTTMIPQKTTTTAKPALSGEIKILSGKDKVQVVATALLFRDGPSSSSAVKGRLSKGTIIAVEERVNGWLKVRTANDEVGYVSARAGLTRPAP